MVSRLRFPAEVFLFPPGPGVNTNMNSEDIYIRKVARMLDECRLDETNRTKPERRINAVLGGLDYGYGFPEGANKKVDRPDRYVGFVPKATMQAWVNAGHIDPNVGENDFDEYSNGQIKQLMDEWFQVNAAQMNPRPRGAAVAMKVIDFLPPDDDERDDDDDGRFIAADEQYLERLDAAIEQVQRENPAFRDAAEIFLAYNPDGQPDRLVAIWCTDWAPK